MNVVRYSPVLVENSFLGTYVTMFEHSAGSFVLLEDYLHLMGVIRKLRTKIEKKNRRSRKFREAKDF